MENPTTTPLKVAKRILRYLKGNIDFGLYYSIFHDYKLVGYSDSDWSKDMDDRKSTIGFVFYMGDTAFTWVSKKQPIVTLSKCESVCSGYFMCLPCNLASKFIKGDGFATKGVNQDFSGQ